MSRLTYIQKMTLEDLFEMGGGYVLDFSNSSFQRFIKESIGIDIYESPGYEEYCSKANKLRQIWDNEPDAVVGKLIEDLLLYYRARKSKDKGKVDEYLCESFRDMQAVAKKMKNNIKTDLPHRHDESLQTLLDDINNALSRNKPTLVLDRLHTFATKMLRQICIDNDIEIRSEKGEYLPLHSLAGMLKRSYEANQDFQSDFTLLAIRNSISLFDSFNEIRNNQSFAHDNDVLDAIEAEFAISAIANVLNFIDKVETFKKHDGNDCLKDDNLPF